MKPSHHALTLGLLLTASMSACAHSPAPRTGDVGTRTRPPATLACERNHLTSFDGRVSDYRRTAERLTIVIDTDWDTRESIRLERPADGDFNTHFLIEGHAFTADDWARIESADGKLQTGMRAIAWVCGDGHTPAVIDWRPVSAPAA